jgi:hypothetical protein
VASIANAIAIELRVPEGPIGSGPASPRAFVAVPKTAMDENDRLISRQHDVWCAGKPTIVKAEAMPRCKQRRPNCTLWCRVPPPHGTHHAGTDCGRYPICHASTLARPNKAPKAGKLVAAARSARLDVVVIPRCWPEVKGRHPIRRGHVRGTYQH